MDELILKEQEYRDKLTQTSNEIGLPAFIMKAVVKDLYEQLSNLEQQQYQEALSIKEQKEKKAENEESKGDDE